MEQRYGDPGSSFQWHPHRVLKAPELSVLLAAAKRYRTQALLDKVLGQIAAIPALYGSSEVGFFSNTCKDPGH